MSAASVQASARLLGDIQRQTTVRLRQAGIANAEQETIWLMEHALGLSRLQILTDVGRLIDDGLWTVLDALIIRRAQREPLQYLLGSQEFCGLEIAVTPAVLIPRPETALLVDAAFSHCARRPNAVMADVGAGSGCIAVALASRIPNSTVWGTDISAAALVVAERNARRHGVDNRINFRVGDLFAALPLDRQGTFDAIVSNPPYIADAEIESLQQEVARYEPRLALAGGADGLNVYRRLAADAWRWLRPQGLIAMEVGAGQADSVRAMFDDVGRYRLMRADRDEAGIERVLAFARGS
ncbi:MAG TPA: peptide chain release factor N(5)-glutamine methyltransferase [Nitrospirales bacterium]|nr:peptide chain release factor N(5)-glutamine methyltransferase [Nitrospirales bacterium]